MKTNSFFEHVMNSVDAFYTPFEGVKDPNALKEVEWRIACNCIPGPTMDRMVANGIWSSDEEPWMLYCYLMQVRDEIMKATGEKSVYPSLIPSPEDFKAAA